MHNILLARITGHDSRMSFGTLMYLRNLRTTVYTSVLYEKQAVLKSELAFVITVRDTTKFELFLSWRESLLLAIQSK